VQDRNGLEEDVGYQQQHVAPSRVAKHRRLLVLWLLLARLLLPFAWHAQQLFCLFVFFFIYDSSIFLFLFFCLFTIFFIFVYSQFFFISVSWNCF
jgi:hypothetical protein